MAFEHAKEYLARALPWPQAHDEPSYVNIHWTFKSEQYDRPAWSGRACQSVEQAVKAIDWALKLPETRDVYVCLSSQREATPKVSAKGFKYLVPIRNQQNAVALKSLFLDIDIKGGENGYSCMDEAVAALGRFMGDTGMPAPSMIVKSGGGIHVYWTLASALIPAEWKPLALALAEATKKHGLKCDTQVTIDCARVLRVPDTLNRKSDPARPVQLVGPGKGYDYTVERITKVLEPYMNPDTVPELPPRPALPGVSELAAGIDAPNSAPVNLDAVAKECGFIRDAIATGGLALSNPLWNLTTLISTFTEGGRADAHRMGKAHPGYTVESTDALFDRKEKEKSEKGLGWPACKTISGTGATACQTCKHFAAGKSPLHTARFGLGVASGFGGGSAGSIPGGMAAGTTSSSDLPDGYTRLPSGVIARLVEMADGSVSPIPICEYKMVDPWLQEDSVRGLILHFDSCVERNRTRKISLPARCVNGMEMRAVLQEQGVMVPGGPKGLSNVGSFFVSWIKRLQETRDAIVTAPFGWNVNKNSGDVEGFVFDATLWTPTGPKISGAPDEKLARIYSPSGTASQWIKAAKMITDQKRPALDAILASAFAAPLVRFTGREGVLMSCYSSESGIGKTSALRVAQAVWANPIAGVNTLDDTHNAVVGKLTQLRSLPLYWDELKTEDDVRKFVKLIFQATGGKGKSRMGRNLELLEPGSWQTLVVLCSNDSLMDYVNTRLTTTPAGMLRVVEFVVPPPEPGSAGQIDPSDAGMTLAALNDHHGHVGREYAKWLGENFQKVEKEVADYNRVLGQEVSTAQEERYWIALMTTCLMGAKYANELGVTEFDLTALKLFFVELLDKMRNYKRFEHTGDMSRDVNISDLFSQFTTSMRARHTLKTNKIHVGRGKPAVNSIKVLGDTSRLDAIYVHVGMEDKLMRFSNFKFREWLTEKGFPRHVVITALQKEMGARYVNGRLGAGTDLVGGTEYLWEIDLSGNPLLNFIDEA